MELCTDYDRLSADYSDFGEEFEQLMLEEIADAAIAGSKRSTGEAIQPPGANDGRH